MLTERLKEKKSEFLQKIRTEFVRVGQEYPSLFHELKEYVAQAFEALERGDEYNARWHLRDAYKSLVYSYRHRYLPNSPTEEQFRYGLIILDLGLFAIGLEGEFLKIYDLILNLGLFSVKSEGELLKLYDVLSHLWEARQEFLPNLADAQHAAYIFRCWIGWKLEAEEAFERAMQSRNMLYERFGDDRMYRFRERVGELLSPAAVVKLRQILMGSFGVQSGHAS